MKATIIQIGNSRGIRIPKPVLQQCGLGKEVDLEVRNKTIIIKSAEHPREEWGRAFQAMAEQADDRLLDETSNDETSWDAKEWEWM
jgi:antitoxin MazE